MAILSNTIATTLTYKTLGQSSTGTAGNGDGKTTVINPAKFYRHTFIFNHSSSYTPSSTSAVIPLSLSFDIYTASADYITTASTETSVTSTMVSAIKTKLVALGATTGTVIPASGSAMYGYNSAVPIMAIKMYSTSTTSYLFYLYYAAPGGTGIVTGVSRSFTTYFSTMREIITPIPAASI